MINVHNKIIHPLYKDTLKDEKEFRQYKYTLWGKVLVSDIMLTEEGLTTCLLSPQSRIGNKMRHMYYPD